ncbi:MAG: DUF4136 domain-containing protein [bacterium]|jgi:hypothetical protein
MKHNGFSKLKFLSAGAVASAGVVLLLLLCSCYPSSDFNSVADYDVVLTLYDEEQDFNEYVTYYMEDTVYHYRDPEDTSDDNLSRAHDALIIATIKSNMNDLGYQFKADADSADPSDLYIVVGASSSDWYSVWYPYYPSYPGWGWWGPGWWWGYPGPPQVSYAYTTGTLSIDMWDAKNADEDYEIVPVPWAATVNGILNDKSAGVGNRIEDSVNQAFAQSPYLGTSEGR